MFKALDFPSLEELIAKDMFELWQSKGIPEDYLKERFNEFAEEFNKKGKIEQTYIYATILKKHKLI